jgi:hypothetical protein
MHHLCKLMFIVAVQHILSELKQWKIHILTIEYYRMFAIKVTDTLIQLYKNNAALVDDG